MFSVSGRAKLQHHWVVSQKHSKQPHDVPAPHLEDRGILVSTVISTVIGVISIIKLIITPVTKSHDPLSSYIRKQTRDPFQGLPLRGLLVLGFRAMLRCPGNKTNTDTYANTNTNIE